MAEEITFKDGYARLEAIAAKLDDPHLPFEEQIALLREGKALELALRGYLEQARVELAEIEAGSNLPSYRVQ